MVQVMAIYTNYYTVSCLSLIRASVVVKRQDGNNDICPEQQTRGSGSHVHDGPVSSAPMCAFLYLFPIPICTRQPFHDLREHRFKTRLWHLCKVIIQGCGKLFVSSFRQVRMRAVEVKPNNPTGVIAFQQQYIS
jgi:hypothetical protein